jgi:hypothetical protein
MIVNCNIEGDIYVRFLVIFHLTAIYSCFLNLVKLT